MTWATWAQQEYLHRHNFRHLWVKTIFFSLQSHLVLSKFQAIWQLRWTRQSCLTAKPQVILELSIFGSSVSKDLLLWSPYWSWTSDSTFSLMVLWKYARYRKRTRQSTTAGLRIPSGLTMFQLFCVFWVSAHFFKYAFTTKEWWFGAMDEVGEEPLCGIATANSRQYYFVLLFRTNPTAGYSFATCSSEKSPFIKMLFNYCFINCFVCLFCYWTTATHGMNTKG